MADACVHLLKMSNKELEPLLGADRNNGLPPLINIGVGVDITIAELAAKVAEVVGFNGKITYDSSKPDGTPRKLLDVTRLHDLGWQAQTSLEDGLTKAYKDFVNNYE